MPNFQKDAFRTPFGRNNFLRSTRDVKTESYMFAAATLPVVTIDGSADQKVLQPGMVIAKATSGASIGKVGPFSAAATDGRQTLANIVGINNTFLPWQLMDRDVEIAVVYECTAVQAWCYELDASSLIIALTNTTAAAMFGVKGMDIHFK